MNMYLYLLSHEIAAVINCLYDPMIFFHLGDLRKSELDSRLHCLFPMAWFERLYRNFLDINTSITGKALTTDLTSKSPNSIQFLNIDFRRESEFMHVWDALDDGTRMINLTLNPT